jgi:hypothetical protein
MKCSKQLSVTMPWGEYRHLSSFVNSNVAKLWLKTVSFQVIPPQIAQAKVWKKFTKSPTKAYEVPFWRSLAGYDSCMELVSKL